MKIGDVVVVVGTQSLPESFLGRYGIVTLGDNECEKIFVEFYMSVRGVGGLTHTAYITDLKKIGEINLNVLQNKER